MYPIALLGMLGMLALVVLTVIALQSPEGSRRAAVLSTVLSALGLAILSLSALGWLRAMGLVEAAVASVNPADRR